MEERDPPDPVDVNRHHYEPFRRPVKSTSPPEINNNSNDDDNNNNNNENPFRSGTYVVQVPKDQVYRVPPPENAALAARHRNNLPKRNRSFCSCCCRVFIPIMIIFLIIAIIGCIATVLLKHEKPKFQIDHFLVKNKNNPSKPHRHQRPEYDVTFKAKNPNRVTSISYYQGFEASLSFKKTEIAVGDYPSFDQEPQGSTVVKIALKGSDVVLPREIEGSLNGTKSKAHISLSLLMNVPVRMKVGSLKTGSKNIAVACSLKLDKLDKKTRVLSQICRTSG